MEQRTAAISENFKKMTFKAIGAIIFFILTYLLLVTAAILLTGLFGFAGGVIIAAKVTGITLMIGAGLISMGLLIIIFLIKFIFKRHTNDISHLTEINREEQPELFGFIESIVKEVKTDFPKKIYLSPEVNASVFYDSSFWSMFFPIRKNLQIGLGLVNVTTVSEFKAILAHEFGHFSQRTMKVGSYVYNVNKVIHNMLYDNDSFENLAGKWAGINSYFNFFIGLAMKILGGIQKILQKVYEIVNISYMALSREMEFHADEVAACVAGSKPLVTSLLRLDIADHSYNEVINYYNGKISESVITKNIFSHQKLVLNFLAKENNLPLQHDLPQVTSDSLGKFDKSKLVIKNQWASHPGTDDRVKELERLNIPERHPDTRPASVLFQNIEYIQALITEKLFQNVDYTEKVTYDNHEIFEQDFVRQFRENGFEPVYNGYYDNKDIPDLNLEEIISNISDHKKDARELFSDENTDLSATEISLERDVSVLRQIQSGEYKIKTFDYDGVKYNAGEAGNLISRLEKELTGIKETVRKLDEDIFIYFYHLSEQQSLSRELLSKYQDLKDLNADLERKYQVYSNIMDHTHFMSVTTSFSKIEEGITDMKTPEEDLKKEIRKMLDADVSYSINDTVKSTLNDYLSKERVYFEDENYDNDATSKLFECINIYRYLIFNQIYIAKKDLLDFQAKLKNNAASSSD